MPRNQLFLKLKKKSLKDLTQHSKILILKLFLYLNLNQGSLGLILLKN